MALPFFISIYILWESLNLDATLSNIEDILYSIITSRLSFRNTFQERYSAHTWLHWAQSTPLDHMQIRIE